MLVLLILGATVLAIGPPDSAGDRAEAHHRSPTSPASDPGTARRPRNTANVRADPVSATGTDPAFRYLPLELLFAQIAMAVLVAVLATATVLVRPEEFDRFGARVSAAVFLVASHVGFHHRSARHRIGDGRRQVVIGR